MRNAISIGGDSDTIGCITGAIAEPLYSIPRAMHDRAMRMLPRKFRSIIEEFEERYGNRVNE